MEVNRNSNINSSMTNKNKTVQTISGDDESIFPTESQASTIPLSIPEVLPTSLPNEISSS
jgi:hypothetical protein